MPQSRLIIVTPRSPALKRKVRAALVRSGQELESNIKLTISSSTPRGRTYRKGSINRRRKSPIAGLPLRRNRTGNLIVGSNFHRASAEGQPPAIDKGRLVNSIISRSQSFYIVLVSSNVFYGVVLDSVDGLNRPFFASTTSKYELTFINNIRTAMLIP